MFKKARREVFLKKDSIRGIPYRVRHENPPKTKRYWQVFRYLMRHSVSQSPIETAILFVLTYKAVPQYARNSIVEFIVYPTARILAVRCSISEHLFHSRWQIAKATGWYPYITGVPLKTSPISVHVDEMTTRNRIKALQLEDSNLTPVELIPVRHTPNHVSFLLQLGGFNILLDAGLNEQDADALIEKDLIDLIVLTHAHFDHSSGIKLLYERECTAPLIVTATTLDYCTLQNNPRNPSDFDRVLQHAFPTKYGQKVSLGGPGFLQLHNAGHLPGSAMVLLNLAGFRILYTGDFYLHDHYPIAGAASTIEKLPPIHVLIANGFFADKKLASDSTTYHVMLDAVKQSLNNDGHALISSDLGGLALTIFIKLFDYFTRLRYKAPCWIEPEILAYMQVVRTRVQDLPSHIQKKIRNHRDPFSSVMRKELKSDRDRTEAITHKGIIISGPNDFSGPPITNYLNYIGNEEASLLVLTGALRSQLGAQIASGECPVTIKYKPFGRKTLKTSKISIKSSIFNVKHPDLRLVIHCDNSQLLWTVKQLCPNKVLWFHNNPRALNEFCTQVSQDTGIASVPITTRPLTLQP